MRSYIITIVLYLVSFAVACYTCTFLKDLNQWIMIFAGHLNATLVVFIGSQIYKNSSLYDAFWSVAPVPIVLFLSVNPESGLINIEKVILVIFPIIVWAIRLTSNWARDWGGLYDEDFRYIDLKRKPLGFLIDLFGIHIYPTLQVNISLLPVYFALSISTNEVNIFLYLTCFFTLLAVLLETIADEQMRNFRKTKKIHKTMKSGLWAYSRHPNYLGEILFWWGIYFMTISIDLNYWYLFVCPLMMNLLFSLITCQMMDKRSLERRSDYHEYMRSTPKLLLWKSN
tara:strand:- start:1374 stop:2225 length:852 start_codon:yes stop_codon:yes gene_type:complete